MKVLNISTVETSLYSWAEIPAYLKSDETAPTGMYPILRIPGIVALKSGTLLAYCECRQGGDWSPIDIGLRRSNDGGRSWSKRQIIAPGKTRHTMNNPVMFADGDVVHFMYCENYKRVFYARSTDEGQTWSKPVDVTEMLEEQIPFDWNAIALGPGHGIVLVSGRLIVPIWIAYNKKDIFAHHPSYTSCIYSDDKGTTWKVGTILDGIDPNETAITQLSDGRVMMNIRNEAPERCRQISISEDDGATWSEPKFDHNLIDPVCAGGLCCAGDALLFVNCQSQSARENVTLKKSMDDGRNWEALAVSASGGYSDVCYNEVTGRAYVLYETENYKYIRCAEVEIN